MSRSVVITALVLSLGPPAAAAAAGGTVTGERPARPAPIAAVPVREVLPRPAAVDTVPAVRTAAKAQWPAATTVQLDVAAEAMTAAGGPVGRAGYVWDAKAPVGVRTRTGLGRPAGQADTSVAGSPAKVQISVLDRAAAVRAGRDVVLEVSRADGGTVAAPVTMAVDYRAFRDAYGADWSRRLRLVSLPACALRTPAAPACRATPLPTSNDEADGIVSATVSVPATAPVSVTDVAGRSSGGALIALVAGESSNGGDYRATGLKPSDSWSAGGNSGDFSWTYPVVLPPSLGGPAPKVALGYSSQGVDGFTAAANSQPSWAGDNATMSLNGWC